MVVLRIRDDVPGVVVGEVVGHDVGPPLLHLVAEEAAGRADFEDPFALQIDVSEVRIDALAVVPGAADEAVTRDLHRVVEVALLEIGDGSRLRVDGALARGRQGFLPGH